MALIGTAATQQSAALQQGVALADSQLFLVGVFYIALAGYAFAILTLAELGVVWLLRTFVGRPSAGKSQWKYWRRLNERYDQLTSGGMQTAWGRLWPWLILFLATILLVVFGAHGVFLVFVLPGIQLLLFVWRTNWGCKHDIFVRIYVVFTSFFAILLLQGWLPACVVPLLFILLTRPQADR